MSTWERKYRESVAGITSPDILDEKILQRARQFKPHKTEKRWASGVASGCTAIAIVILLAHPAQYLGALTPTMQQESAAQNGGPHTSSATGGMDPWYELRTRVQAGAYVELCNLWRQQVHGSSRQELPRDLEKQARERCRVIR